MSKSTTSRIIDFLVDPSNHVIVTDNTDEPSVSYIVCNDDIEAFEEEYPEANWKDNKDWDYSRFCDEVPAVVEPSDDRNLDFVRAVKAQFRLDEIIVQ
jgi:hypothetical protein